MKFRCRTQSFLPYDAGLAGEISSNREDGRTRE